MLSMPLPNPQTTAAIAAFLRRDADGIGERLLAERVGLAFDGAAAETAEGRVALELAVRLVARLWPRLAIVDLSGRHSELAVSLSALAISINPEVYLSDAPGDITRTLVVGDTALVSHLPAFYVGSQGWIARFSPDRPVGSSATDNPFGAAFAACLGVANLLRSAFADDGLDSFAGIVDEPLELSTFDHSGSVPPADPGLPDVDLGETHLVGLGAVGGAATWTLGKVPHLTGTLHLIDGGVVERSTLARNVLATRRDIGKAKVAIASGSLASTGADACAHARNWASYVEHRGDWHLPRVAVALGSARDRIAIQAALPRVVLNAWTQTEDIGVSRHPDFLRAPCLACLYGPERAGLAESEVIATAIGLLDAEPEIRYLLYSRGPVERSLLERIAAACDLELTALDQFEGRTVADFYDQAVSAGLLQKDASAEADRHAPMVFQSAMAGVLLAAEIVIDAALERPPIATTTTTRVDLRRPLTGRLVAPAPRDPYGRCICRDADYRVVYARKYAAPERVVNNY